MDLKYQSVHQAIILWGRPLGLLLSPHLVSDAFTIVQTDVLFTCASQEVVWMSSRFLWFYCSHLGDVC